MHKSKDQIIGNWNCDKVFTKNIYLVAVPKATKTAFIVDLKRSNGFFRVNAKYINGSTIKQCTTKPSMTVSCKNKFCKINKISKVQVV